MPLLTRSASLTNYIEVARSVGLRPYEQLAAAGIDRCALLNPDHLLSAHALGQLLEASAQAAGIEDFGLRMAESRQLANHLGPVALALREEPTVRQAMEAMGHYMHLHNQALALRMEEADGLVLIRPVLNSALGSLRQSTQLVIGMLFCVMRHLLGPSWRPHSICFMHAPPAHMGTHRRVFGTAVRFHQEFDGIVCRAADLQMPLPSYDPFMAQQARRYLDGLLAQAGADMAGKVRQLILALLPLGHCSVERIARQLGVDRRTVHHHLSRDGLSYADLLNTVRKELAVRHVQDRERALSDIATLLGFASLSAFSRWFRQQFGCSASAHQDQTRQAGMGAGRTAVARAVRRAPKPTFSPPQAAPRAD